MRKFDLSLRSSRSSYFATFRHQLTILSKTDALDEEKWLNMLGTDRKSGSAGMPRPISYAVILHLPTFPTRRSSDLYLDKAGITTACLRIKSKWTAGGK